MRLLLLLLVLTSCSPDMAEALVVKGLGRGKPFSNGKPPSTSVSNTYAIAMGTAERVATTSAPWTDNYTALTLVFWHKHDGSPLTNRMLAGKSSSREFEVRNGATDATAIRFVVGASTSNYCETAAGVITANWKHFIVIFNGGGAGNSTRCYIYANGADVTSAYGGTIPASIAGSTGQFSVNAANGANNSDGSYDEVAVWRTNQTSNVATLYNSGAKYNMSLLNPVLWWRMGDTAGDTDGDALNGTGTIYDATGNGWTGTGYTTDDGDISTDAP